MELTALEFARLLHDLKCDVKPDERRTSPRAPTRVRASVIPITPGQPARKELVWVRDVSRGGFGITSQTCYAVGSRLLIVMPKSVSESFVLLCEICRMIRVPGNTFTMGARMLRKVTAEEHAALLAGDAELMKTLAFVAAAAA